MNIFFKGLEFGLEGLWARHFLISVVRVACGFHPCGEEEASFLGFGIASKGAVALLGEAFLALCEEIAIVSDFLFAVGEEAAVCCGVLRDIPAHLAATVKCTESATRDHDVKLSALHVVTDVGCHHDESLALECLVVCLGFVLACTGKGESEALAACCIVTRSCSERVGELVAHDYRNLACASGALATGADATIRVADRGLALGIAGLGSAAVFRPCAVRHAAIPITGGKALLSTGACIEVLGFFSGGIGVALRLRTAGGFRNRARRLRLLLLRRR